MKLPWTQARKEIAFELYKSGLNCAQIAEKMGSNSGRVRINLRSMGIQPRRFHRDEVKVWSAARDAHVSSIYLAGESQAGIARFFNTNTRHVRDSLLRCGVQIRKFDSSGSNNPAWNGGRYIDDDGYVLIYAPSHPHARESGHVLEHRLVIEKLIGRFLKPAEVVHHIELPKSNNAPSNLQLYSSNAEHLRDELKGRCPKWTADGLRRLGELHARRRAR